MVAALRISESVNGRISESVALDPFSSLGGEQALMVAALRISRGND
jgi:hypothetical protein